MKFSHIPLGFVMQLRQRSKQKRERKQIRELEDQKRISEELGAAGETDRDREQDALDQVLAKHGLKVFDIPVRFLPVASANVAVRGSSCVFGICIRTQASGLPSISCNH